MQCCVFGLLAAALLAGQTRSGPVVRGTVLDWDTGPVGDLSVRMNDNHVVCFRFDAATTVDLSGLKRKVADLHSGDTVEIVTGPGPNRWLRHAREIRVLASAAAPKMRSRAGTAPGSLDDLFPRGDLVFAGVVAAIDPARMVLRTRGRATTEILLRPDTRYVHDGGEAEASLLQVNTHVFVRAGRNLNGEIEAYRVMWGDILHSPANPCGDAAGCGQQAHPLGP